MISVVACTNRKDYVPNIIDNFRRQTISEKELIVILNSSLIDLEPFPGVRVYQFPDEISLGECLNRGVILANYDFVAKMDDDDYYGANYLEEAYQALVQKNSDLVGKSSFYIYFKKNQELRLYNPHHENRWIVNNGPYKTSHFLSGATLVFRKDVLKKVMFPDVNLGEDSGFQRLCYENGLKMYSLSKEHYVYVRYHVPNHHHSDAKDPVLRRRSKFVANTLSLERFLDY